jgi:outer membrane autotransporter protein
MVAVPLVTFQGTRQVQGLFMSRLENVLCGPPLLNSEEESTCNKEQSGGWWLKGFGYSGSQGARNSFSGYDASIVGATIGYDTPLDPNTRIGFGLGYAQSELDSKALGGGKAGTDFDSYRASVYIGHERGPWYVHGNVSAGLNTYSSTRDISFTGIQRRAEADFNGQDYTGFASSGYRFAVQGLTITPRVSLQYTHVALGGYTETGAGDINLRVQSQSYDFLESGLGVKVARPFEHQGARFVPEVHFNWLHALSNPALANVASFTAAGSSKFATPGMRTADDTFNVGAGLTLLSCVCSTRAWDVEAVYDYHWRNDQYAAHQGVIRVTGRF